MIAPVPTTKTELKKYYAVRYKGKIVSYLNPRLAQRQGVTVEGLKTIKNVHRKILKLFDKIRAEDDVLELHLLAEKITELDFQLQDAWGFERDANFHTWWYKAPKCTCAKMDNHDYLGTPLNSINLSCPLHGDLPV